MNTLGKKIMIIGCCGAGKSTLARELGKRLDLPVVHLDRAYFKDNWEEPSAEEWAPIVQELASRDEWIIDGNYGGTMDIRLSRAESIIFLHYSRWLCLYRVLKRIYKYRGTARPDMNQGCKERLDFGFLHYVFVFNNVKAPRIIKKLKALPKGKKVHHIHGPKALKEWMDKALD